VVEAAKGTLMVGFNRRFDPDFMRGEGRHRRRPHRQGGDGHDLLARPRRAAVDYIKRSGGIFRDMTIHDFDMARWLLGEEPDTVQAAGLGPVDPRSARRATSTASTSSCAPPRAGRRSSPTRAAPPMATTSGSRCWDRRHGGGREHREANIEIADAAASTGRRCSNFFMTRYTAAYAAEIAAFVAAIRDGTPTPTTGDDGRRPSSCRRPEALAEPAPSACPKSQARHSSWHKYPGVRARRRAPGPSTRSRGTADAMQKTLDVITIGRSSVDLYGAQVGGRLEDMGSSTSTSAARPPTWPPAPPGSA
jgi:hypothetical protein